MTNATNHLDAILGRACDAENRYDSGVYPRGKAEAMRFAALVKRGLIQLHTFGAFKEYRLTAAGRAYATR